MYNQEVKKHCRSRLIKHAIKSLTTERSTSVCVKRDHARRVWQQKEEAQTSFRPDLRKKIEEEIGNWELFHDSRVQKRTASDLRVCYLCGDNPINDLEVFVENGVLCQNVWAIEKDGKVLEEAWKNVAESNMMNIRLFKGDFLTCLKDLEGQFDIIYFDACGTLPSTEQKTLKTIGYVFLYNKLTSPGALITNFSFPPEQKHEAVSNDSYVSERNSFEHLTNEYLLYRLWNTKHQDYGSYEELREAKIDPHSIDEKYGDYITFQVIDSAYLYIPAYRMLSSEKQSLWDQLFVNKKEFLNGVKEADWSQGLQGQPLAKHGVYESQFIRSTCLYHLSTTIENCESKSGCLPCKTWVEEIFPNWKSSKLKKEKLFSLILTHLLSHNAAFIETFGNDDVTKRCLEGYRNSPQYCFCDPSPPEYVLGLIMGLLYGQMAYPSFPVIDKSLRLKYTAKDRQMFSDVFIFDKCRYLYENFPSIHFSEFAMKELWQQMLFRMVADGLRKHIAFLYNDMFWSCNVASVNAPFPGGIDSQADSHCYIPDREVLDFAYFKENESKFVKEEKLAVTFECYNGCLELFPEGAIAIATIYNNKAIREIVQLALCGGRLKRN